MSRCYMRYDVSLSHHLQALLKKLRNINALEVGICYSLFVFSLVVRFVFNAWVLPRYDVTKYISDQGYYWETYLDAEDYYQNYLYAFRYQNWDLYSIQPWPLSGYVYGPLFAYILVFFSYIVQIFHPEYSKMEISWEAVTLAPKVLDSITAVLVYLILKQVLTKRSKKIEIQSDASKKQKKIAARKNNIEDVKKKIAALPPDERAKMEALLNKVEEKKKAQDEVMEEENAKLPKWFEPNQEVKDIVDNASKALRMGLTDEEKIKAIEQLDGIDHPIVIDVVNEALDEPNEEIREAALDAVMEIADPVVVPTVMKALDDESPDIREYALDALMDINDESINEALIKALDDENADVRDNAIDTMLYIEEPCVIPALTKAMESEDPDVREKAIITIEDIPDPRVVDSLINIGLLSDDDELREDALDSIEFITDQEFENYDDARTWWEEHKDTFEFE